MILDFAATFIISAVSFYWYEKPFLQLKSRFTPASRPASLMPIPVKI
jgi:peptidoglycan/LPS O-acetylase OafA/YrhL